MLSFDTLCAELLPKGRESVPWSTMAVVLVLARRCEPSSEVHIAEDWYRKTALEDLLGLPSELVNADRLYRALDRLLPHKTAIEQHLKPRLGELFALDYELLLYAEVGRHSSLTGAKRAAVAAPQRCPVKTSSASAAGCAGAQFTTEGPGSPPWWGTAALLLIALLAVVSAPARAELLALRGADVRSDFTVDGAGRSVRYVSSHLPGTRASPRAREQAE